MGVRGPYREHALGLSLPRLQRRRVPRRISVAAGLLAGAAFLYGLTIVPWLVIGCAAVALIVAVHRGAVDPIDE